MELILSDKAYRFIIKVCDAAVGKETGGILIGKIIEERFIVPISIGPGSKAKKSKTSYSPDLQWQQTYLDKLYQKFSVNYIGSYHLHPGNYCHPSHQDLKTVKRIISDPEWNVAEAVFPILTKNEGNITFHPYHFARASKRFHLIDWKIVPHNDLLIKSILRRDNKNETKNHRAAGSIS